MLCDIHIHSCLSPCGDDDMTPNNIAGMAHLAGLDVIALTDHNSADNAAALEKCAGRYGIAVIGGIEVNTAEDIHLLCYFDNVKNAEIFGRIIEENLPPVKNRREIFGSQQIMDENDVVTAEKENLLINACALTLEQAVNLCHEYHGKAVYAHIDRDSYSVLSVLGALPQEIEIDGVEIYDLSRRRALIESGVIKPDMPFMSNSDAHYLEYIGDKRQEVTPCHPLYDMIRAKTGNL